MVYTIKNIFLCTMITIGAAGLFAIGRTLQQAGEKQQPATDPPANGGPQIHGVPRSPNATATIDGRYLPPPPSKFRGEVNVNAAASKPYWPPRVAPPKDAPNILLIMTPVDDNDYQVRFGSRARSTS